MLVSLVSKNIHDEENQDGWAGVHEKVHVRFWQFEFLFKKIVEINLFIDSRGWSSDYQDENEVNGVKVVA